MMSIGTRPPRDSARLRRTTLVFGVDVGRRWKESAEQGVVSEGAVRASKGAYQTPSSCANRVTLRAP